MPAGDTGGGFRLPQLGQHDSYPHALKVASIIYGATSSDGDEDVIGDTQATVPLFVIGGNVLVTRVWALVETAFTAAVTLTLGDSDDADGFKPISALAATVVSSGTNYVAADDSDGPTVHFTTDEGKYILGGGKYYSTSATDEFINLVVGGADPAVGRLRVFCEYVDLGGSTSGTPMSTST